jgi:hypothetical protein
LADQSGKPRLGEAILIGLRDHASHLIFKQNDRVRATQIQTGLTPYFAYTVLYDPGHGTVGFKPRPVRPQDPRPIAAN